MPGFVYILKDDNNKFYIGSSKNVDIRFIDHVSGNVHTTARMLNPKIIFMQEYSDIQIARKIERRLKKLKRKDYISKIIQDGYIKMKL